MEKSIITNKTYKIFLLTLIILSLAFGLYSLIAQSNFLILISMSFSAIILVLILKGNKNLKLIIKIIAGLAIIGCTFRFASIALLLFGQLFEEIKISSVIENIVYFAIALYLYIGSKKYIKLRREIDTPQA